MTRLIIGCGYLGQRIADQWRQEHLRVFATTRSPARAPELADDGIEPVVCDVLTPDSLRQLPSVDVVVYAVGMDRTVGVSMRQVYVEGLGNVLDALPGTPRIVYISSTSVYGQGEGQEVDEQAETHPVEESGKVVLDAERRLRQARPDAIVLRFAGIYGPARLLREKAIRAGEPLASDPDVWLNLIHVEDGVRAVRAAESRAEPGAVYNVCDDHPVTRGTFYSRLAQVLSAPPPRFAPPPTPDRVNRRILNHRLHRDLGIVLRYPDCAVGLAASV